MEPREIESDINILHDIFELFMQCFDLLDLTEMMPLGVGIANWTHSCHLLFRHGFIVLLTRDGRPRPQKGSSGG